MDVAGEGDGAGRRAEAIGLTGGGNMSPPSARVAIVGSKVRLEGRCGVNVCKQDRPRLAN